MQQDIRIPASFSAAQLQSLLASRCIARLALSANSQGYLEPRRPAAALATFSVSPSF